MATIQEQPRAGRELAKLDRARDDDGLPLPPDPRASIDWIVAMLWRRKWLFLLVFLLVSVAGFGVLLLMPERYTAHATLIVGVRQPELATPDQLRQPLRTEPDIDGAVDLMKSQPALRRVVETLQLDRRPEFASALRPRQPSLLERLRQRLAALRGRSLPSAEPVQADPVDAVAASLRAFIKIDRVGRSNLIDAAYSSGDPKLAADIVNALATVSATDESLVAHMTLTERSGFDIVKTSIVSLAVPPERPSSPNAMLFIGGSLFLAVGAALTAVLFKEYWAQQTVLSTEELARHGMRALGLIPSVKAGSSSCVPAALLAAFSGEVFGNAITSLQAALSTLPSRHRPGCRVFLFTSALPEEGKSTTAAALAVSLALSGQRVLLIDADLRSPTQHRVFGKALSPGLSDWAQQCVDPEALVQTDLGTGVHLLAAGGHTERPLEVLGSARLRHFIDSSRASYDVIVFDSPPVLSAGDARLLATLADDAIIVAGWGRTTWKALDQAWRLLVESGARIAGVAISEVKLKQLAAYDCLDATICGEAYGRKPQPREG